MPSDHSPTLARPALSFPPSHVPFPRADIEQSISCRFERQVELHASRVALKTATVTLTYRELGRRVAELAVRLRTAGVAPGQPVVLMLEHDALLVVTILAVLKLGALYVPIDPTYPSDRNRIIMEDSGAEWVLVSPGTRELGERQKQPGQRLFVVDEESGALPPSHIDSREVSPDACAFVLYTSGSTGRPKGVIQTHRNVLHNIMKYTNALGLCPDDRMTLLYSCSVIGSMRDLFGALLNGAELHLIDVRREGLAGLAEWIRRERITFYNSVTTLFRHFMGVLEPGAFFSSMRLVRLGGEASSSRDVELVRRHFSRDTMLYVGLGTTETGTIRELYIDHSAQIEGRLPSGYAVDDYEVLICDEAGRPLGPDEEGEIVVRSRYLSPGYWKRPDLTAAVFVPDPDDSSLTRYRTGDLGRIRPDGCLEHLGRLDFQVKIRGHRIEVAEVELALLAHPMVAEAAVVTRRDASGDLRLAACYVPASGIGVDSRELRKHLAERLPQPMIPAEFVQVISLPLTPNGKVDRRTLEAQLATIPAAPVIAPTDGTETELALIVIWQELLARGPITRDDHFFELGGDSLQGIRLLRAIEQRWGSTLPLSVLLQAPTVSALAALLDAGSPTVEPLVVPLQTGRALPPFFCIHGIGGGVLIFRQLAALLGADQPFYGVQAASMAGHGYDHDSIEAMADCYVREIRKVQPHGPYYLGGLSFGGKVALEMARRLRDAGETVALLVLIDTRAPGYPKYYPLARRLACQVAALFREKPEARWRFLQVRLASLRTLIQRAVVLRRYEAAAGQDASQVDAALYAMGATHLAAARSYRPAPYPGTITLLRAMIQPIGCQAEPTNGWGETASDGVDVYHVPGDHATLLEPENLHTFASSLRRCLEAARQRVESDLTV